MVVVTDREEIVDGYWHSEGTVEADNNSQNDEGYLVTLNGPGGIFDNTTADMGYYEEPAAVGNFVWNDLNANGLQDTGESGLEDVGYSFHNLSGWFPRQASRFYGCQWTLRFSTLVDR